MLAEELSSNVGWSLVTGVIFSNWNSVLESRGEMSRSAGKAKLTSY